MRGIWAGMAIAALLALPTGAGADFGVTSVAGVYQGDGGVQVKVYKSSNGKYLGDAAQATTIGGCPVTAGHTLWIIDGNGGQSAKVYGADCEDNFGQATFAFSGGYVRVCTADPNSDAPPPTSSAAMGSLPGAVGTTGCNDLKQVSSGESAGTPHT